MHIDNRGSAAAAMFSVVLYLAHREILGKFVAGMSGAKARILKQHR